ncbi:sulfur transfer protein complex, TusD subunit [Serratia symbiotica str. 'Cinara cedri']|nr:sulfur transfer protein complex, TusD subunit [Serratia symbiotica str. 'Cinara cedri']
MALNYCLLVTGPAYGTQQASSAYQFSLALLAQGHIISSIFFYHEGVLNANKLTAPASDEFDLVRAWKQLAEQHSITLNVCIAAALRRGVTNEQESRKQGLSETNLQPGFTLSGLGALSEALLSNDRIIQF